MVTFKQTLPTSIFVFLLSTFSVFLCLFGIVLKNSFFQSFPNSLKTCFKLPLPGMWKFVNLQLVLKKKTMHAFSIIFIEIQAGYSLK